MTCVPVIAHSRRARVGHGPHADRRSITVEAIGRGDQRALMVMIAMPPPGEHSLPLRRPEGEHLAA